LRTSLLVPIAFGGVVAAAATRFAAHDSDLFWHLATARETLAHGLVRVDAFSWTAAGRSVAVDQWLGQVIWYGAYLAAEWRGVVALRALASGLLVALIVYGALRERPSRPLIAALVALPAVLLSRFVWTERPELFGFVCFALLVILLRAARDGNPRALLACAPLVALWANLHGSFAVGVVLLGLVSLEGALAQRLRRGRYALAFALGALASLLNPAGVGAWTAPGSHFLDPPRGILEWSVPDVTHPAGLLFTLALVLVAASAVFGDAPRLREAVVLVPLLFLALTATRQLPFFVIAATPFLARHLPEALARLGAAIGVRVRHVARGSAGAPRASVDALAAVCALAVVVGAGASAPDAPDQEGFPVAARASLRPGPGLLNQYDWGGWLIWYAPDTRVFVDGRLVPYRPDVLSDYAAVVGVHPEWRDVLARRGVRALLVRPADPVAVRARDLGWPLRASGEEFVLFDVPDRP